MKNTLHDYHLSPQRASSGQYKRLCLFLLTQLCFLVNALAQTSICAIPEPEPSDKRYSACGSTSDPTYIAYNDPTHTWYDAIDNLTPKKTVHLAFVIWHRADGTGGWPNTPASHNLLRAHIRYTSDSIYGANYPATHMPIAGTALIPDTRIRFVVDTIYHMYNTYYYETSLGWPNSYNTPLYAVAPEAKKTLNIHVILGDTITYRGAWGWTTGASSSQGSDVSIATKMGPITYMEKSWAGHLAHELAHDLGLNHLYGYWNTPPTIYYPSGEACNFTGTDYLTDVYGTTPDPYIFGYSTPTPCNYPACDVCPHKGNASNNIMSGGGDWPGTNFSPLQIGRMHRVLQGMNTRKYTWGRENRPYIITANETWNFNIKMYQDLVIPAGKKLIIKCRVEMVPDARITVEPGGVLEVDGGTITSAVYASVPWQGIEVIGNSLLPQKPVSGGYPQGRLILKNNALIENARNAVTTWKYGDWNSTGGLIQATDATFHNNGRSVEFMAYSHPENSYFANCTFLVDAPLLQGNCMAMVTAWEVKGTRFLGNRFEYIPAGSPDIYPAPKGIYTISAGFSVTPACNYPGPGIPMFCFPTYAKPNTFKGLLHGIEATNGPSKTFKVDSAHFEQCAIGVYASAVNMFEVVRSKFDIKPYYGTITQTGLSNDAGTGFKIQNNSFYSTQPAPLSYKFIGLSSNNTGSALNEVYRNDYKNMFRANTSSMINWAAGASTNVLGLKYKCNKQSVNKRDINISDGTIGQIQGVSGTPNYPAANTFSVTSDPQGHISNSGTNYMIYIYGTGTGETPTLYTSGMVFPVVSSSTTACPSLLSWGGIVIADKEKEFFKAKAIFDGVQKEYEAVLAGTGARGAKDSLEGLLAKYAAEWNGAADELIRHYISDSIDAQPDSVAAWVARKGDLAAQVMQADMEAEQQNYTAAMTKARVIKTAYPALPAELVTELDTRISYYSLLNGYRSAGNEYWNLDTPQQRSLYRFASAGTTAAHSQAKNILAFFYGYIFSRETPVKEETGSKSSGSLARMDHAGQNSLIVSPNPASDQVRLEWMPGKELHRLEIVNLTGVSVFRQDNIPGNQLNIDTRSFPSGIYTGSFSSVNGSDKQVFRLVIQH